MNKPKSALSQTLFMGSLIIAGEAIFLLPFIIPRIFRPTVLDVLGITNLQLGNAFALYGIVATISYLPGGALADRFSARKLMSLALVSTAAGGVFYALGPDLTGVKIMYAVWGMTTVLLFWAALIRATRTWGGESNQGKAFGLLDGGRGLVSAMLASISVAAFAYFLPGDAQSATLEERTRALNFVVWLFTGLGIAAAAVVWFCVPDRDANDSQLDEAEKESRFQWSHVITVMKNPAVWLQGSIVVCAYASFRGTDDFGLYAQDAFGFDDVQSAKISTLSLWIRPFAAFGAGALADRFRAFPVITLGFVSLIVCHTIVALGIMPPSVPWMLYAMIAATSVAIFALRGLYLSLFGEANVPPAFTGTAAGLVSLIGYTPDIFMGPLMGYFTDTYEGGLGHQYLFGILTVFAVGGLISTILFHLVTSSGKKLATSESEA